MIFADTHADDYSTVHSSTSDRALVVAAKAGSSPAFTELFNRYAKRIYWRTFMITRNHEDAEDALQDSFLNAYSGIKGFQEKSQFYSWLVRIAINSSLMVLRRKRRKREIALEVPGESAESAFLFEPSDERLNPEELHIENEYYLNFMRSMHRLPPKLKVVVESRLLEECSTSETGELLGLSEPAVKSRLRRARLQMKESNARASRRKRPYWSVDAPFIVPDLDWAAASSQGLDSSCRTAS